MIELVAALRAVIDALESAAVDYIVVGSVGAAVWGVARTTRDVDLVAMVTESDLAAVLESLARSGMYVPVDEARAAAASSGSFNVLDVDTGGKVDVFVASAGDDFEQMRLTRRRSAEILGVTAWVAAPEDVVLAKLRWRLDSRSEVQWRDCVEIVATNDLDDDHLRDWAERLGVSADLEELLMRPS